MPLNMEKQHAMYTQRTPRSRMARRLSPAPVSSRYCRRRKCLSSRARSGAVIDHGGHGTRPVINPACWDTPPPIDRNGTSPGGGGYAYSSSQLGVLSVLMLAAAIVQAIWGVAAERRPLEAIARPLAHRD